MRAASLRPPRPALPAIARVSLTLVAPAWAGAACDSADGDPANEDGAADGASLVACVAGGDHAAAVGFNQGG